MLDEEKRGGLVGVKSGIYQMKRGKEGSHMKRVRALRLCSGKEPREKINCHSRQRWGSG